ncbi:ATPase of the AAA class [Ecytonucleospora hepatopenaei]|uniref:ATPase of the AAA class n=1 Tax=Ecytonucleospora hepatopenaei TaxID=646526 RepID=A0A1W0E7E3_9MICR|nr:ATPase of the AAA class [Ecytonucleospora hepatopenaei]
MIQQLISKYNHTIENYENLVNITEGYSGSDIFNLCREVSFEPLREIKDITTFDSKNVRPITEEDFLKASRQIRKSVSQEELHMYEKFNSEFGST